MDPKIEKIRTRAYELFIERRGGPGDEMSDWLKAEAEICAQDGQQNGDHCGPARMRDPKHWGHLTSHSGHDLENPT